MKLNEANNIEDTPHLHVVLGRLSSEALQCSSSLQGGIRKYQRQNFRI